jgi:site-specific DNA-methyltransferase (adenine-specific)
MKLFYEDEYVKLIQGDCLEVMDNMINKNIKMNAIIADIPYGTTQCKWDEIIPFDDMWDKLLKLTNKTTPIVLFGNEPFSSKLRLSNLKMYKYDWKWNKVRGVGHLNAKKRPMMCIEDIMVFYDKQPTYNPQMREREKPRTSKNNATQQVYGKSQNNFVGETLDKKYPLNLITYSKSAQEDMIYHPTQKPLSLIEYLISTYTNEGDTILDFTCGSGTTLVAAQNLHRKAYGIELDEKYCNIAKKRLEENLLHISNIKLEAGNSNCEVRSLRLQSWEVHENKMSKTSDDVI